MLPNGYGTPVVRIFNDSNDLVLEGATRFKYVHSELVDDASTFTIETDNVSIVDNPNLQEGKALKLVFGYLPDRIIAYKVYIWDLSHNFTETGIRIEITAYCKAAYAKLNSSQKVWGNTTLEQVAEDIAEEYGLVKKTAGIEPGDQTTEDSKFNVVSTGEKQTSAFDYKNLSKLDARDNTAYIQRYAFRKYGEGEGQPQANKSDRKLLDDLANQEPVDNLFINGRNDDLIIQRRNLNQKPYKAYTYKEEPGYLKSFAPSTKNSQAEKASTANIASGWLEDEKEFLQSEINPTHSSAKMMGDKIGITLESLNAQKLLEGEENLLDRPISIGGILQEEYNADGTSKRVIKAQLDSTKRIYVQIAKRGTRPSQVVFSDNNKSSFVSSALDATGRIETRGIIIKDPKEWLPTVESKSDKVAGVGVNRNSRKAKELHTADITIVGDPELRSSKIIQINGVGKKYSGSYYLTSVTHEITPEGGYLCYCKAFRNALNSNGSESGNKVDVKSLGLDMNTLSALPGDGTEELSKIPLKNDR